MSYVLDETKRSVVAVCSCGAREVFPAALGPGPVDAWMRAHQLVAHPAPPTRVSASLAQRERRH